jgi:hypothetical protein
MKRLLYCSLLLSLAACSPNQTTLPLERYSGNLVVNGDGEQNDAPDTPKAPLADVSGWTRGVSLEAPENATAMPYSGYLKTQNITIIGPAGVALGKNLLMGGLTSASNLSQTIDLSGLKLNAKPSYVLSALLGGAEAENDHVDVLLELLDKNSAVLESVTISGPRAQERGNKSQILAFEKTGTLPTGTVKARVKLSFTRESGVWNEGFADNISLKVRLE